jgi:putative ABC transport system permease protein
MTMSSCSQTRAAETEASTLNVLFPLTPQFLTEAPLVSGLGGVAGTIIGGAATAIYAVSQHWSVQIPAVALYGGVGAALAIRAVAGLYPSMRAARLSPTEALRTV